MASLGFLSNKKFYIHLGLIILVTFFLMFLTLRFLAAYTQHGKAYILPDLQGKTMTGIEESGIVDPFDVIITDSIYDNDIDPGTIVMQNPAPGSKIKSGRNIYVTIVAVTPAMVKLPNLKDFTLRQALSILKINGVEVNRLIYQPYLADNAIIGQYFEGDTILSGTEVKKGSKIDLVVGQGQDPNSFVPFVIGLSQEEAREMIRLSSFNIGAEYFLENTDRARTRAYKQEPRWSDTGIYPKGTRIDVWYRSALNFNFDSLRNEIMNDSIRADTIPVDSSSFLF